MSYPNSERRSGDVMQARSAPGEVVVAVECNQPHPSLPIDGNGDANGMSALTSYCIDDYRIICAPNRRPIQLIRSHSSVVAHVHWYMRESIEMGIQYRKFPDAVRATRVNEIAEGMMQQGDDLRSVVASLKRLHGASVRPAHQWVLNVEFQMDMEICIDHLAINEALRLQRETQLWVINTKPTQEFGIGENVQGLMGGTAFDAVVQDIRSTSASYVLNFKHKLPCGARSANVYFENVRACPSSLDNTVANDSHSSRGRARA